MKKISSKKENLNLCGYLFKKQRKNGNIPYSNKVYLNEKQIFGHVGDWGFEKLFKFLVIGEEKLSIFRFFSQSNLQFHTC